MSKKTLQQQLQEKPDLPNAYSYSVNLKGFVTIQEQAIKSLEAEIENLFISGFSQLDIAQHITKAIILFVPNFCFSIEAITNYYAALLNPISRYDFSAYVAHGKNSDNNRKTIEASLFGKSNSYSTLRKLKILLGAYWNQKTQSLSLESNYPVTFKIITDNRFQIKILTPLPEINMDNLPNMEELIDVDFSQESYPILFKDLINNIASLIEVRDYIVHPQPFNIRDSAKQAQKKEKDFLDSLEADSLKEIENFLQILDVQGNEIKDSSPNAQTIMSSLYQPLKNSSNGHSLPFPHDLTKSLLITSLSHEMSIMEEANKKQKSGAIESYFFALSILHILKFSFYNLEIVFAILKDIQHDYSLLDTHIQSDRFDFLLRELKEEAPPINLNRYIAIIKEIELGHPHATLFDVLKKTSST